MNDAGRPPLARVNAFGNFWHGYYSNVTGWRSRSGASMPGFTAATAANSKISSTRFDAHLVDFSMPSVETPAAEATLGMERWNKAILHGNVKYYAINSARSFGVAGWPYRAPDGTVFHLMMETYFSTPPVVQLRAGRLTPDLTAPTTVIASIEVPYSTPVTDLNFAPDGSKAAAHSYNLTDYAASFWDNCIYWWIVEAAISGGSATVLPTATLTLTPEGSGYDEPTVMVPEMAVVWVPQPPTYSNVTATTRTKTVHYQPRMVQAGGYEYEAGSDTRALYSTTLYNRLIAVVYGPDGARRELLLMRGGRQAYSVPTEGEMIDAVGWVDEVYEGGEWRVVYGTGAMTDYGHATLNQTRTVEEVMRMMRDTDAVATISGQSVWQQELHYVYSMGVSQFLGSTTISGPVNSGNAYNAIGNSVFDSSLLRCTRVASNVVITVVKAATWGVLSWAGSVGNGQYSYSSMFSPTNNRFPAVHPETGAMSDNIRLYF